MTCFEVTPLYLVTTPRIEAMNARKPQPTVQFGIQTVQNNFPEFTGNFPENLIPHFI
jgi:hypothetical protein